MAKDKLFESFQGWNAYAKWADSLNLRVRLFNHIEPKGLNITDCYILLY